MSKDLVVNEGAPLLEAEVSPPNGRLNIVIMGLGFLFLFSGFNTTVNYLTSAIRSDIALASLSILYGTFALTNFISPVVVQKLGPRMSMVFSAGLYVLFILSAVHVIIPLYLVASALCGAGAAILWTAQGTLLTNSSTSSNIGFHSGLFFGIFQINSVVGPVAAIVFIAQNRSFSFIFFTFFIIACLGVLVLFFLRPVPKKESTGTNPGVLSLVRGSVYLFRDPRVLCMTLGVLYTGGSAAFFSATFPGFMNKTTVAIALMSFGFGEVAGSLISGKISEFIGRRPVFIASLLFHVAAVVIANLTQFEAYAKVQVQDVAIVFCAASMAFGFGDSALQTMLYAVIGNMFSDNSSQAFAWYKTIQSVGYMVSFLLAIYFHNVLVLTCYFLAPILGLGFIGLFIMDIFLYPLNIVNMHK
eukprot:TRINITY_DN5010_c0_g1_i5.p1 TRINITY_DN5010_c0_g1~~TRINITY_DN5010_c0_g1_i5.p1  ORF type:complete len:415 (+),score=81.28 TRINITY_DN5010_c0_g1_i5:161-1405(+)